MTGDVLLSNMLFRYRDLPVGIKMPDSPESLIKSKITSSSSSGMTGVNGSHSPHPPGGTPSPPISSSTSVPHHLELSSGNGTARSKHSIKVKQFLATLQQFATEMSVEVGERVHSLIIGLVSSSVSIEDFHHKVQEITNYPLRPFAIPFLKSHLPILQTELLHFSRLAKQSPQQYLRQHEHLILDATSHPASEPFDIFQDAKENGAKRRSPSSSRNGKLDMDYNDSNGDCPPPPKRHHPNPSPSLSSRTSPSGGALGLPPGLNLRLPEEAMHPFRDGRIDRYDRFERDLYRPFYGNIPREYAEDREMEEEWRNIHTMLNCILGMVEKTKRALCILQHRSLAERAELWLRHHPVPEVEPHKKRDITAHFKIAEDRVSEVRRRAEEAVQEVKRAAVAELQKAVSAAESKAGELVAAERLRLERRLHEARRQAAEDASHQEESTESCWNCGRKGNETCSGCNVARYCGSFCQHKDWESHHRVCSQTASHPSTSSEGATPPRTTSDHSPSPSRTLDVKPAKIDVM